MAIARGSSLIVCIVSLGLLSKTFTGPLAGSPRQSPRFSVPLTNVANINMPESQLGYSALEVFCM